MDFKQNSQKNEEHKFSKQINRSEIDFMFHINRLTKLKDEANILFKAQEEEGLNEYLRVSFLIIVDKSWTWQYDQQASSTWFKQ